MHREGQMQFQSPVALRLLPTLPLSQQLKPPPASGSMTDRGSATAVAAKNTGSKTHRVMASTNASSLAAVKQASERNQSLFEKISASVANISSALLADGNRDADAAEEAHAAQDLSDVVNGIIRPSLAQSTASASGSSKSNSTSRPQNTKDNALATAGRPSYSKRSSTQKIANTAAAAPLLSATQASSPLVEQIEKLMIACGGHATQPAKFMRGGVVQDGHVKTAKNGGKESVRCGVARVGEAGVLRVRHVPLGFTDKKMRALFGKFGDILGVKMESKFGVVKVAEVTYADLGSARAAVNAMNGFVSKDVIEPLGCSMKGDEEESAQASHSVMKDNILNFSRQNSKLCVAEADFERLFKSKDDMTELYRQLCDGAAAASLLKIEVWLGLHYSILLGDGLRRAYAVVTGAPLSQRIPLNEEQFPLFLVKLLYYTQALLLFNAIDTDANRRLDLEEFRIAMPLLNLPEHVDVERLFRDLDHNGSGVVRYEEFCDWLESSKRANFEIIARHAAPPNAHHTALPNAHSRRALCSSSMSSSPEQKRAASVSSNGSSAGHSAFATTTLPSPRNE